MVRIVIFVVGGVVQQVDANKRIECCIVDSDTDEENPIIDPKGEKFDANIYTEEAIINPQDVEHYFQQESLVWKKKNLEEKKEEGQ